MTTARRLLADVDALLLDVLLPATALGLGNVVEELDPDYLEHLPVVHAYRWGGAAEHPRFLDVAVCDVHAIAQGKTAALELAETCRVALYEAWERQLIYPHGSIAGYEEISAPTELRTARQADNVTRVQATYRLRVCPPPTE
jgi:hypothetical protein